MIAVRFETEVLTSSGGREVNEDRGSYLLHNGAGCWVVADGLGGMGGGEIASQLASDAVLAGFRASGRVASEVLSAALQAANQAVCANQQGEQRLSAMRSTAVVLLADAGQAQWAHIGDSRLYHFRDGRVAAQTLDHSVPQMLASAGEIHPNEIRFHEDRNRLLQSLGARDGCRPEILKMPVVLEAGDAFLLASDGFWEHVTETEMEADLATASGPAAWLRRMEARLKQRVSTRHDNYTAIAVFATGDRQQRRFE